MNKTEQYQINNKGKCFTCKENKRLDTMLRKDGQKGLYECIDCKTEAEGVLVDEYKRILALKDYDTVTIKAKKLKDLIKWVLG